MFKAISIMTTTLCC